MMLTSIFTPQISFLALHKGAFSVSKGHFLATRRAFSGFEKGDAQNFFQGLLSQGPLLLTDIVHQSPRNLDPPLSRCHEFETIDKLKLD